MPKKAKKTTSKTAPKTAAKRAANAATKRPVMPLDGATAERIANALETIASRLAAASPAAADPAESLGAADAFVWHPDGRLAPVPRVSRVEIGLLKGVDRMRDILMENTERFTNGLPANNALLWGARGMGKSSLVKAAHATINADRKPADRLKLIEIHREDIESLPGLMELLRSSPFRCIVFCDDLSFEAGEGDYRVLKSVLDGSLERAPENVLLYATSNRRHLVPERQSDNENWQMVDGELHPNEAVEDKIALSDRFGLWLSFYPFSQQHYLSVVRHWIDSLAGKARLQWDWDEALEKDAIRWATGRGNRNGRCAYQYARQWVGARLLDARR